MSEPYDYSYLRQYHTNIRHGDNVADCSDCNVGKCDVPDLVDDYAALAARVRALTDDLTDLLDLMAWLSRAVAQKPTRLQLLGLLEEYVTHPLWDDARAALQPPPPADG